MAYASSGEPGNLISPAPLILNTTLAKSTFTDYLGSGFKIRESNRTPADSVILPRSGIAILLVYLAKIELFNADESKGRILEPAKESGGHEASSQSFEKIQELIQRIQTFHKSHQGAIIIMVSAVFGEEEVDLVSNQLLGALLPRPPLFLLAHGEAQAASHVQLIAKATQTEMRQVVKSRMLQVIENLSLEIDPVTIVRSLGLSSHDASVLMDTYGNIGSLATLSAEEIHQNTPLEKEVAHSIAEFFIKDQVDYS